MNHTFLTLALTDGGISTRIMWGVTIGIIAVVGTAMIVAITAYIFVHDAREKKKKNTNEQDPSESICPDDMDQVYDLVYERIINANGSGSSVLFAATDRRAMPITIPVNTALRLADQKHRCLLIDLDTERDAIAHAFEIEENDEDPHPRKTPIENISIWPAHYFNSLSPQNLPLLIQAAKKNFDYILISAPQLNDHPQRGRIAACAQTSLLFSIDLKHASHLATLFRLSNSKLICHIQVSDKLLAGA